jgi:hypothetical protein
MIVSDDHGHIGPVTLAMDGRGQLHLAEKPPSHSVVPFEEAIMQPMTQQFELAWLLHRIAGSVEQYAGAAKEEGGGRSLAKRVRIRECRGAKPDVATLRERCDVRLKCSEPEINPPFEGNRFGVYAYGYSNFWSGQPVPDSRSRYGPIRNLFQTYTIGQTTTGRGLGTRVSKHHLAPIMQMAPEDDNGARPIHVRL